MRGNGQWNRAIGACIATAGVAESIEDGGVSLFVAIASKPVSTGGIEGDQDDVGARPFRNL
jgi:hypothetical protein